MCRLNMITAPVNLRLYRKKPSPTEKGKVKVYGADDVNEGVAIMIKESVDVSITGNSTNLQDSSTCCRYIQEVAYENGKKYFSVASGGGTGRTLHPDNMAAGPASYGLTDSMGRMHGDAQFAGSSSVPAHVEMMGLIGMGNNRWLGLPLPLQLLLRKQANSNFFGNFRIYNLYKKLP